MPPNLKFSNYTMAWNGSGDGRFSMKSAYVKVSNTDQIPDQPSCKIIFRHCAACKNIEETLVHVFRDCHGVVLVWQFFIRMNDGSDFYSCNNWHLWLLTNLSRDYGVHGVLGVHCSM